MSETAGIRYAPDALRRFAKDLFAAAGGRDDFLRQTGWLADTCHDNPPRPGVERVRLPGENGLARKRAALADGLRLFPGIIEPLRDHAERLGVPIPSAL
jgi:LDH2 family malate/lactate/ureidoglycolate dehydrogenase